MRKWLYFFEAFAFSIIFCFKHYLIFIVFSVISFLLYFPHTHSPIIAAAVVVIFFIGALRPWGLPTIQKLRFSVSMKTPVVIRYSIWRMTILTVCFVCIHFSFIIFDDQVAKYIGILLFMSANSFIRHILGIPYVIDIMSQTPSPFGNLRPRSNILTALIVAAIIAFLHSLWS